MNYKYYAYITATYEQAARRYHAALQRYMDTGNVNQARLSNLTIHTREGVCEIYVPESHLDSLKGIQIALCYVLDGADFNKVTSALTPAVYSQSVDQGSDAMGFDDITLR